MITPRNLMNWMPCNGTPRFRLQTVCKRTDCLLSLQQTEERTTVMGEREEDKGTNSCGWRWPARYTLVTRLALWRRHVGLAQHSERTLSTHGLPLLAHTGHHETRPHEPSLRAAAAHHHPPRRYCASTSHSRYRHRGCHTG